MSLTKYTRISFNRTDLFTVCKVGFIAQKIGDLWCDGWVQTDRLSMIEVPYITAKEAA